MKNYDFLMERAKAASERSYSPYSSFKVGAALLAKDGSVYEGCNIENAAFTPTVCAERVAVFSAINDGKGAGDFEAIAVVAKKNGEFVYVAPCGVCRQVLREFCDDKFLIIMLGEDGILAEELSAILPRSFSPSDLG